MDSEITLTTAGLTFLTMATKFGPGHGLAQNRLVIDSFLQKTETQGEKYRPG
jgi:hypothetical protein